MLESLIRLAQGMFCLSLGDIFLLWYLLFLFFLTVYFIFCSTCKINVQKRSRTTWRHCGHIMHWILHDNISNSGHYWRCSALKFYRWPWWNMYPNMWLSSILILEYRGFNQWKLKLNSLSCSSFLFCCVSEYSCLSPARLGKHWFTLELIHCLSKC